MVMPILTGWVLARSWAAANGANVFGWDLIPGGARFSRSAFPFYNYLTKGDKGISDDDTLIEQIAENFTLEELEMLSYLVPAAAGVTAMYMALHPEVVVAVSQMPAEIVKGLGEVIPG